MNDLLITILTSTVLATIISSIFTLYSNKKSDSLKYITSERCKWRKNIRTIAQEISQTEFGNIQIPLTKLKVQINSYGNQYYKSYEKDSHIWELIDKFDSKENFEKNKNMMVEYLSLLLKFDWERSKEEVNGTKVKKIGCSLLILSFAVFMYYYFVCWHYSIGFIFFFVLFLLLFYYFILPNVYDKDKLIDLNRSDKIYYLHSGSFGTFIFISLLIKLYFAHDIKNSSLSWDIICILFIMTITVSIPLFDITNEHNRILKYRDCVEKVKVKYEDISEEEKDDVLLS